MNHWEQFYLRIIKKEEKGYFAFAIRSILWLFSFPYRFYVGLRNLAYDKGFLSRYTPPIPLVISIGNIVAGGVGKTPVTMLLAEAFYNDFPLAILTRGYRSKAEKLSSPVVACRGFGPVHPASYSGDEPFLMAENFPKSFVIVGRDRREASSIAAKMGSKLVLLDDAMQHRRIQRDLEVVVLDKNEPWGFNHFLPRGLLREARSGLKRASIIIVNHHSPEENIETLKADIAQFSSAPVIGTKMAIQGIFDINDNPVEIDSKKVALFCGIGHPEYFVSTVKNLNADIVKELFLGDHQTLSQEAYIKFSKEAEESGAEYLICTEKDKVKIVSIPPNTLPVLWVKVRLVVTYGKEDFDRFIQQGRSLIHLHG